MIQRFEFTDQDFLFISKLVFEHAGISLNSGKKELVYGRLAKRLRILELTAFSQYCELLQSGEGEEFAHCVNAITTNVTAFYRENHHFEFIEREVLPARATTNTRKIKIWSAGCSTGQEPYSIAMCIKDHLGSDQNWDIEIFATDLDSDVLDRARQGVYPLDYLEGVSDTRRKRWFMKGKGQKQGLARLKSDIRNMVSFAQLNLMSDWQLPQHFDLIFCRNVMIYFNKETRQQLLRQFADNLAPNGYLFVGHSESLSGLTDIFTPVGTTIYRKSE